MKNVMLIERARTENDKYELLGNYIETTKSQGVLLNRVANPGTGLTELFVKLRSQAKPLHEGEAGGQ